MIAAIGAVRFAIPRPKILTANNVPTEGPQFGSTKNKIDFPAAATCSSPNGAIIP